MNNLTTPAFIARMSLPQAREPSLLGDASTGSNCPILSDLSAVPDLSSRRFTNGNRRVF